LGLGVRVPREEVERIARLAALAVNESSLAELTTQIGEILEYVAQLEGIETDEPSGPVHLGPERAPLRPDTRDPTPLTLTPREMAPEFDEDFYVVPKVEGVGDEE
jgi:aspartyl-tRNA(Asn)/glutamyl-tRNA(Gln) amidotransferase subunit C